MAHRIYHIDSRNRLTGSESASDFRYKIDLPFRDYPLRSMVARAVIPKTFLNCTGASITLNEGGGDIAITVPAGNYSFRRMATKLKELLDAGGANTYTITADVNTGKFTFVSSGASTIVFNDHPELFGVTVETEYVAPFTSPAHVRYHLHDNLRIHSDLVTDIEGDILANIRTADTPSWGYVTYVYHDKDIDSRRMSRSRSNVYSFRLSNDLGKTVDLNGSEFSFDLFIFEDHQHDRAEFRRDVLAGIDRIERLLKVSEKVDKKDN